MATLGPALGRRGTLRAALRAGVHVTRLNMAHGTPAEHTQWVARVRKVSEEIGRPVSILADLGGPKIRVRNLPDPPLRLRPGRRVDLVHHGKAKKGEIPVNEPRLIQDLRAGDPVYLADGTIELEAVRSTSGRVTCRVVTEGLLVEGKGINVPDTKLQLPAMTRKDRRDLANAVKQDVDMVALSFVRGPKDLDGARKLLESTGIPLLAKVEKAEAVQNLDAIVRAADGVMVARGDLGVETDLVNIPMLQKRIIRRANAEAKPVITATQMLASMVESPRPTRAEVTDVANAILDGTDAVMLSDETAVGRHPTRSVDTMARIARAVEAGLQPLALDEVADALAPESTAVSHAAFELAENMGAAAIVTPTRSGTTARLVARRRPSVPVVALSQEARTVATLRLSWGVIPVQVPHLKSLDGVVARASQELRNQRLARVGQPFVLTAGYPAGGGHSNLLTVQRVQPTVKGRPKAKRPARPRSARGS